MVCVITGTTNPPYADRSTHWQNDPLRITQPFREHAAQLLKRSYRQGYARCQLGYRGDRHIRRLRASRTAPADRPYRPSINVRLPQRLVSPMTGLEESHYLSCGQHVRDAAQLRYCPVEVRTCARQCRKANSSRLSSWHTAGRIA